MAKFGFYLRWFVGALVAVGFGSVVWASESKTESDLRGLVGRQHRLMAMAAEADDEAAMQDLRPQMQRLVFDYERFLRENSQFVPGYVSFAMLLGSDVVDERRRAVALLLKANELDPNLALVKNQIGNYLAEEGKPREAINYYLAAADLEPDEPLYHYQVGLLLAMAREDFEASGEWDAATIGRTVHDALGRAYALAPDNFEYGYRFAQSFYELAEPDWAGALAVWRGLKKKSATELGRQTVTLQEANVLLQQGKWAEAEGLLDRVEAGDLQLQRAELRARLAAMRGDAGRVNGS